MLQDLYRTAKEEQKTAGYCVVGQWAITLPEDDRAAFDKSIDDVDFSTRSLFKLYQKAGAPFGLTSLLSHRNGDCACR
jgi:hypothetical protein